MRPRLIGVDPVRNSTVIRPTPWRGRDLRSRTTLVSLSSFRDWLYRCRRTWTRAGYARRRMRAARARIRAREQCRVSPRPCRTTYHHPGPEPTPVLSSLSLSFSLFILLSSLLPTDRPTDQPIDRPNPIDPSADIIICGQPSDCHVVGSKVDQTVFRNHRRCRRRCRWHRG